jgi:hypothetical protein
VDSDAADSHLPTPTGGGGDAAPADSGANASVRLAGRTSSTQLTSKNDSKSVDPDLLNPSENDFKKC